MCLSLLFFTQLFSKVARSEPAKPARKQNSTRNSRSGSFKVMHFWITEKPTTDCVSLYNNAGFISEVPEKNSQRNAENCRCRQPHYCLTPPPQGTCANIRINLIPPDNPFLKHKVITPDLHFYISAVSSDKAASFMRKLTPGNRRPIYYPCPKTKHQNMQAELLHTEIVLYPDPKALGKMTTAGRGRCKVRRAVA